MTGNDDSTAYISRLAEEMVKLYINDWKTPQSAEFEATRAQYLQAETDKKWRDYSDPPPRKDFRTCG